MDGVLLAGGLVLLAAGGEFLVRSAIALARQLGLPPLLIGITVVAAATSAPELAVSIRAALAGTPGIAVGNVVGSNIANLALGLGFMALVAPFLAQRGALSRDLAALLAASVVFILLGLTGEIGSLAGVLMVTALAVYLWRSYERERRVRDAAALVDEATPEHFGAWWSAPLSIAVLALSVGALVVGARLLLDGAVSIANALGVSDTVIGVTVVAFGTSLPEIATTAAAAVRHQHDVALGNLVGSSVFNLFAILGITAIVHPIPVSPAFVVAGGSVMLATTLLVAPVLTGRWRLGRAGGAALLIGYGVYIAVIAGTATFG